MKKWLCVWLALLLSVSLMACGGAGKESADEQTETPDLLAESGDAENSQEIGEILSDIEGRLAKSRGFTELPDAEWKGLPAPEVDEDALDGEDSDGDAETAGDAGQSTDTPADVTASPANPEPVAEAPQPSTPEPVAQTPQTPTPEPVAEAPQTPAPEPVAEAPQTPAPEPVAQTPQIPAPEPVAEAPQTPAPEPVAQTPQAPEPEPVAETPEPSEPEPVAVRVVDVTEGGAYTSKEEVSLYLHRYGRLPGNFITKEEARELGWNGGSLEPYASGKCIGGDYFGNYEKLLPEGRSYHECDIDTLGANSRGAQRLVYSDDGLIYYTPDHYNTFILLYGEE